MTELKKRRSFKYNIQEPGRGEATRQKIFAAAITVFSKFPYKSASIRMIGKEAGIEHPLINYYYPAKADLIKAVLEKICNDFTQLNAKCFEGLNMVPPDVAVPLYVDRLFEYHVQNPEPFRVIAMNIPQADKLDEIPGYEYIINFFAKTKKLFEEKISINATTGQIEKFIYSFNNLTIVYLGAGVLHAQLLGMDHDSDDYKIWVKQTLSQIFVPMLESIIFSS